MEQGIVFATLVGSLVLFTTSVVRYDMIALLALMTLTVIGIVPAEEAFLGFGNPAVITVAAVLVISRSLENSGLVTIIGNLVAKVGPNATLQVGALTSLVTLFSAFINNVGALALLMPVAIQLARNHARSPSFLLMPMAFGSLLGGMTTLIGTPPNLIISDFRRNLAGQPFRMFDYSHVGIVIAVVGVAFISLLGWRLVPKRRGQESRKNLFRIDNYVSEVIIEEGSDFVGQTIQQVSGPSEDVMIVGLIRDGSRVGRVSEYVPLRKGDELIVRADSETLPEYVENHKLSLSGEHPTEEDLGADDLSLVEAVVTRYSRAERKTAVGLRLHDRYGASLLGVARKGEPMTGRLREIAFQMGDVLLLQMPTDNRSEVLSTLGLLPLAERQISIGRPRRLILTISVFAVAQILSAIGIYPSAVTFSLAGLTLILCSVISLRDAYESIDWSIIVLLGAMIPVGQALETTGGANSIAQLMLSTSSNLGPPMLLVLVIAVTMLLSDVINNAAAAIVMAPVAMNIASGLNVSADPFLLGTAIGASCAFLTPIGHQCNTIVLGPGGYAFGDYWRLGIVVELIVLVVSVPLLLHFWPLN